MSIKPDHWIMRMAQEQEMIVPFVAQQVRAANISYGLSGFGYDIRLSDEFKLFTPTPAAAEAPGLIIDPKKIAKENFRFIKTAVCTIAANSFLLGKSLEHFKIPETVLGIVVGKSTYARCGVLVNVTPLEPGWEGFLTISISNTAPCPVKLYAAEGIAQVVFFESEEVCLTSYRKKQGKYQGQRDITLSKVE